MGATPNRRIRWGEVHSTMVDIPAQCTAGRSEVGLTDLLLALVCSCVFVTTVDAAQWARTFGGNGEYRLESVQQTVDGGYVVAGSTDSSGAGG